MQLTDFEIHCFRPVMSALILAATSQAIGNR
jgi:hypothetical protein